MLPCELLTTSHARREAAERLLRSLVDTASGSADREGVSRVLEQLAERSEQLGLAVELVREDGLPRHLVARSRPGGPAARERPVLLIGHADTVFPKSDTRRFSLDGERIRGPGCADMKGGLVVALEAIAALGPAIAGGARPVELIVNGDEELGSPSSRSLIRELAAAAHAALVFENSEEEDSVVIGRKGLGRATLRIRGRAAHAGIAPQLGASAVLEMAREVLEIAKLDDPARGVGVVVGKASGGISRNTVPPEAEIEVDLRYVEKAAGESALERIREIAAVTRTPGTHASFEGELHRPPMSPERASGGLFAIAARHAAAIGRTLRGVSTGGGSDANLTADLGVPTLDGLGVVGSEIHTRDEWCLRRSIPERAALAAAVIGELIAHT